MIDGSSTSCGRCAHLFIWIAKFFQSTGKLPGIDDMGSNGLRVFTGRYTRSTVGAVRSGGTTVAGVGTDVTGAKNAG